MYKKRFINQAGIAIVVVVLVIGGIIFYNLQPVEDKMMEEGKVMAEEGENMIEEGKIMKEDGEKMIEEGEAIKEGEV